jgi:hypothetical protein
MTQASLLPAWYVAFYPSPNKSIWTRWLKRGFQHCCAFAPDEGRWLLVDGAFDVTIIRAVHDPVAATFWALLKERGATVLLVPVTTSSVYAPRLIATCATLAASLVGVRGFCALTPYRLYRTLLARGATIAMEP